MIVAKRSPIPKYSRYTGSWPTPRKISFWYLGERHTRTAGRIQIATANGTVRRALESPNSDRLRAIVSIDRKDMKRLVKKHTSAGQAWCRHGQGGMSGRPAVKA